jgi:hypothetical protein
MLTSYGPGGLQKVSILPHTMHSRLHASVTTGTDQTLEVMRIAKREKKQGNGSRLERV